jgi:hypothetical protein
VGARKGHRFVLLLELVPRKYHRLDDVRPEAPGPDDPAPVLLFHDLVRQAFEEARA